MLRRMETIMVYWGYIGIMEKKMETTIVYWGYIGIMDKKNGNYHSILGLHWVNVSSFPCGIKSINRVFRV